MLQVEKNHFDGLQTNYSLSCSNLHVGNMRKKSNDRANKIDLICCEAHFFKNNSEIKRTPIPTPPLDIKCSAPKEKLYIHTLYV